MAANAKYVNPDAEVVAKSQALHLNCAAANGLQMVLRSNLGAWLLQRPNGEAAGERAFMATKEGLSSRPLPANG